MPIAKLSVDLEMSTASLQADADKAARIINGWASDIATKVAAATGTVIGIGAVSAVAGAGVLAFVNKLNEMTASLHGLAEESGASAAALASFRTASDTSGVSLDVVAGLMVRLSSATSRASSGTTAAAAALKALNIPLEAFRALKPDEQLELVAQRLAGFAEGGGRAAVAVALLGRSGAAALPFLNDLAEQGRTQITLTQEQIDLADSYSKAQAKARSQLQQLAQVAATEALPAEIAFTEALRDTVAGLTGVDTGARSLAANTAVKDFSTTAVQALGFVIDAGDGVVRTFEVAGKGIGAYAAIAASLLKGQLSQAKTIGAEFRAEADAILQSPLFSDRLNARLQAGSTTTPDAPKPVLDFKLPNTSAANAAAREAEQVRKAERDQALKALEDQLKAERDAYAFQGSYLDGVYAAGLISLDAYYAERRDAAERDAQAQQAAYSAEIAALKKYLAATKDPSDRITTQTKINELQAKAADATEDRARRVVLATQQEDAAYLALDGRIAEFRSNLLQLQGDDATAAAVRAAQTIAAAKVLAAQSAGRPGAALVDVDELARATQAANAFAEVQRRVGAVSAEASTAEQAFLLRSEQSGLSLRDTEAGLYAIRATSLVQLGELRDKADQLAAASTDPKILQAAKDLGLAYAKAAENVDPAIIRLRDAGKDLGSSLAGTFTDALEKGGRFKDLLNGIGNDFRKVIDKAFIQEPLEKFLQGTIRDFTEGSGVVADFIRAGGTGKSDNAKKGLGIDAAGKGFNAAKDGATADATAAQVQAVTTSTNAITSLSAAAQSAATALNRITGPDIVPAGVATAGGGDTTPLIIDRSGVGINAAGAGYNPAKDGASGTTSTEAASKLLDSQTALTTANLASEAATIASAAGFREAGSAIRVMATTAQLASQALALIQTTSTASSASSSGGGFLSALAGLFGGSSAGSGAAVAGNDVALAFAKGGAFDKDGMPGIQGFSVGGVFNTPHLFKFANGGQMSTGVLGEAGPEAILPLKRGPNGALGVSAGGMGMRAPQGVMNTYNINVQMQAQQGVSRATAMQQGADVGRGIQRALARNG